MIWRIFLPHPPNQLQSYLYYRSLTNPSSSLPPPPPLLDVMRRDEVPVERKCLWGRQALAPCRLMMPARRAQNSYKFPYIHIHTYVVCVEAANNATCSGCISCLPPAVKSSARQRYYHHRSVALFGFWQMANGSDSVTKCEIDCWLRQVAGGVTVKRQKKEVGNMRCGRERLR